MSSRVDTLRTSDLALIECGVAVSTRMLISAARFSLALIETQRVKWDRSRRVGGGRGSESERWGGHRVYSGATWSVAVIPGPGPSVCVVRRLDGWMRARSTHQQWKPQRIMFHRPAATGGQSVWGENANEDELQPDITAFISDHTLMGFVEDFF